MATDGQPRHNQAQFHSTIRQQDACVLYQLAYSHTAAFNLMPGLHLLAKLSAMSAKVRAGLAGLCGNILQADFSLQFCVQRVPLQTVFKPGLQT